MGYGTCMIINILQKHIRHLLMILLVLLIVGMGNFSFVSAQDSQSVESVDVDGTWYLGEGLKIGDYFEYDLCDIGLNECAPINLKFWIKGEIPNGSETLWDTEVIIIDGEKIIKGSMGLGKLAPEPVTFDPEVFQYAIAFKASLAWLSAFATGNKNDHIHGPKAFRDTIWGKIGAIDGSQLSTKRAETITTPVGTKDSVVLGWHSGEDNEIWVVDDFPFPVKALTYASILTGVAPIMHEYTLLDFKENITEDPFKDISATINQQEVLGCTTEFRDYTSERKSTSTFSMVIQYNYSPELPMEGCNIDWKINFKSKYNEVDFVDQVHYDIQVVDEENNKLRSHAEDIGKDKLFNGFGQAHIRFPVREKPGIVHYAIFIYGTGPESEITDTSIDGHVIVDIEVLENPALGELSASKSSETNSDAESVEIPSWIKQNAGWWADGSIDDASFIQAVQFLIEKNIIKVSAASKNTNVEIAAEVPQWVKTNAKWWAEGSIDDLSFLQGIEFLIENGIIVVQ